MSNDAPILLVTEITKRHVIRRGAEVVYAAPAGAKVRLLHPSKNAPLARVTLKNGDEYIVRHDGSTAPLIWVDNGDGTWDWPK